MSPLLRVLANEVQIAALIFMAAAYGLRIAWLLRFPMPKERTLPAGNASSGARLSLMSIARPGAMESARKKPGFYLQFVGFHVGVAAAIGATFIIPYRPEFFQNRAAVLSFQAVIGAALVIGILRLVRRISNPAVRLISAPDDYLSLGLMILFFLAAILAIPWKPGRPEGPPILFFGLTAFFLIYVPFSKIGHYLYYPFSRIMLGRVLGHRGAMGKGTP